MILTLLCHCKNMMQKIEFEIQINDPWLYLQFGGPGIESCPFKLFIYNIY